MEEAWKKFKANVPLRRSFVLLLIIACLYEMRAMMNTILLTFIFTFVIVHIIRFVQRRIPNISSKLIVCVLYIIILLLLYFAVTVYVPMIAGQIKKMVHSVISFYESDKMNGLLTYLNKFVNKTELIGQAKNGMKIMVSTVTSVGTLTVSIFMSLILSFFYTIQLKKVKEFSKLFIKNGIFKWVFEDVYYFGKKFVNTFGVVLEAQSIIAICNTVLTTICLAIMRMPQIFALSLMVFILSMVPVAGVIISLVPLSIIAYSVGGVQYVIYIIVMIIVIHALESYVLNPRLMASKTNLPIFYTFLVLLVSEHFFGIWGLIVGVPIFTFLLDIFGIKPATKTNNQNAEQT